MSGLFSSIEYSMVSSLRGLSIILDCLMIRLCVPEWLRVMPHMMLEIDGIQEGLRDVNTQVSFMADKDLHVLDFAHVLGSRWSYSTSVPCAA